MKMLNYLLISICLFTLAACAPGDLDNSYSPKSLPYYCIPGHDESNNSCTTGTLRFSTFKEMCAGLQSDDLNRRCAETERRRYFADFCDGTFARDTTPKTPPPSEPCSEVVMRRLTPIAQ